MKKIFRYYFLRLLRSFASKWIVLIIDLILVAFSFVLAYSIRNNLSLEFELIEVLYELPIVLFISLIAFLIVGSYKGVIRYTGTKDAFNVFLGITLASLGLFFLNILSYFIEFLQPFIISKSVIAIHYFQAIFILIISRFTFKAFFEVVSSDIDLVRNVLIFGAGEAGIITYNALNNDKQFNYDILGFIDDDNRKINKKIDRVSIYSTAQINQKYILENEIKEVIISTQNIKASRLLEITNFLMDLDLQVKIIPPLSKWIDGDLRVNQIQQINIDDLLNREKIQIDNPIVQQKVNGKIILISGAAGSIGSEIVRQLSSYSCKRLVLIDQSESALYELQQELIRNQFFNFSAVVADVRDLNRMEQVFAKHKPDRVFHAAAYKHVPLMEASPYEAINVNIMGTKNIADLSFKYEVERFVLVSTDKAVNPTNIMGATKRAAEIYVTALSSSRPKTKFTITRFGNVLGSNGSVIPLFKKQIENGGPLTVTHKDITRYFMTIPEACSLVLEAGTMGKGGEIYIFDMGKSVKIYDLAKRMISLSGLRYPEDINIKITGLRPGEKLFEELLANGENTTQTYHKKIMIAKTKEISSDLKKKEIIKLCTSNRISNPLQSVELLKSIVPEFISQNSDFEALD